MATSAEHSTPSFEPKVAPARSHAWLRSSNRDGALRRLLAVADVLGITVALTFALFVVDMSFEPRRWIVAVLTLPAWVVMFKAYGLYDRDSKRVSHSTVDDVPWLFHAVLVGTIGLGVLYWAMRVAPLSFTEGFGFFLTAVVAVLTARAGARAISVAGIRSERVLLLGGGTISTLLVDKIRSHPEYGRQPVGYVDANAEPNDVLRRRIPYLGRPSELEQICREEAIDRVIVVAPSADDGTLAELIRRIHALDVRVSLLPQLSDVLGSSVVIDEIEGVTVLGINPPALDRSSRFLKRVMDLTLASLLLALSAPLLVLIALAIKLSSPGPVLFTQFRVGRQGKHFRIVKFRTMNADAEERAEELRRYSTHPVWLKLEHDPRVTRVGRFLRHTSMDELPQLWNVLKGEMSLVGPRPMPLDVDDKIGGWGRRRLDLTPGLTGLWQMLGRTNIPFEEMVKLDYLYVSNWSLWEDTRILIRTLPALVRRRGVN